ncbi:DnaJ C-terminal domain-containing protein, partial [Methanoregula sp.]|uniref:DnaJ C-terminal domain-containing protein n=1 Tax=Methanoregula sp. TaxID=2052170 RepID=UPI000CC17E4B
DLFIEILVRPHERFIRDGDNLETGIEITPPQAVLGTSVEIETIDKRNVELKVPAGIQSGTALKIPGEGVRRRGRPGDLLVRVRVVVPKKLSPEEKDLYHKLLDIEGSRDGKKGFFDNIMGKKKGK